MSKGGLCALNKRLAHIRDTECSFMRRDDIVVDNRGKVNRDVILCHTNLLRNLAELDLHVDRDEFFGKRVNLDETGVDCTMEFPELGNETDATLVNRFIRIRANDATRNGTKKTDKGSQTAN